MQRRTHYARSQDLRTGNGGDEGYYQEGEQEMNDQEIKNKLEQAKELLDSVYYHYEASGEHPWRKNALTTIDLLLIELIEGE